MIRLVRVLVWAIAVAAGIGELPAEDAPSPVPVRRTPAARDSRHFRLRTDLMAMEADAVLDRMEATLRFAVQCWGRPALGQIECYVAQDLANWPDSALPHPLARVVIGGVGGGTFVRQDCPGSKTRNTAVILASSTPGVAEHEVIHAYCAQNFGASGPYWYKEGMAEMASQGPYSTDGMRDLPQRLALLRQGQARTIRQVVSTGPSATRMAGSLEELLANRVDTGHVPLAAWNKEHADSVRETRQEYLWSWALCYLLHNNPNYAERFRMLGGNYLTRTDASFDDVFAPMAREIVFEYGFFLERVDVGYRVDLCRWDWHKPNRSIDDAGQVEVRCAAARGWQASDLIVTAGKTYTYKASGFWNTGADSGITDANGHTGVPGG